MGVRVKQLSRTAYYHLENGKKVTIRAHQGNFDCFMSLSISAKADLHWCNNNETATNDALAKEQTVALTFDASCQLRLGLFLSRLLLSLSMPSSTNIHFTPITPMQFLHFSVPRPNTQKKEKKRRSFWTLPKLYPGIIWNKHVACNHFVFTIWEWHIVCPGILRWLPPQIWN